MVTVEQAFHQTNKYNSNSAVGVVFIVLKYTIHDITPRVDNFIQINLHEIALD
jgi:hypothetical protein